MSKIKMWKPTTYIGVDPGQKGGLVSLHGNDEMLTSMPETERDVWAWFEELGWAVDSGESIVAVIEKVHSMPKQGVSSTFKFGMGYGGLRMALIAASISFEEVTPQAWLKALKIPPRKRTDTTRQWKKKLRAKAQQLYPEVEVTLETADALLIATYCKRKCEGTLG